MNLSRVTLEPTRAYIITLADGTRRLLACEGTWEGFELLRRVDKPDQTMVIGCVDTQGFAAAFAAVLESAGKKTERTAYKASPDLLHEITTQPKEPA